MSNCLRRLNVRNFRSLAEVAIDTHPLNLLFGPNGVGKSTLLDTIWYVRDCAIRSAEIASSTRSHGIGLLYDGAEENDPISICLETDSARYELSFGFSAGRIEPFVGERLWSKRQKTTLIERSPGSDKATLFHARLKESVQVSLREPQKLSLGRYLDFEDRLEEPAEMDRLLHFIHFYHSRSFFLHRLKQQGSESSYEQWLWDRGDNLWSVLRNLHDRKSLDSRYDTIMQYMMAAFPVTFDGLVFEQTGPSSVYASFLEKGRRKPIRASGVSDGHLQMLILLTALFAEGQTRDSLLLLDEPELSLHPKALAVLAEAVKAATESWNKQVFLSTHSPVLISQFSPENTLALEVVEGRTKIRRLSEMTELHDLLDQYAAGSLYEAGVLAPQGT